MNVGLLVTKEARRAVGDETLKSLFENKDLVYMAELGGFVYSDLRDNEVRSLVILGDAGYTLKDEVEQKTGISPLAMDNLPSEWVKGKSVKYVTALLQAYISKASQSDLAYRVQPVHTKNVDRRSLLRFKFYQYVPYPVLAEQLHIEREINRTVELCPKGALSKTPEGPQVTKPEECSWCGYCSGSSYLGYLENPTFSTTQFVEFVNKITSIYGPSKMLFSCKPVNVKEGVFPVILPCIAYVPDAFLLASYAAGLQPMVYLAEDCRTKDMGMKRMNEMPSHFPGTNLNIVKITSEKELEIAMNTPVPPMKIREIPLDLIYSRSRRRSLMLWSIKEMSKEVPLDEEDEVPSSFYVTVDTEKCVLCGVCVRECQMLVPQIRNQGDSITLEYDEYNCIGSGRCLRSCPEKAITVKEKVKLKEMRKVQFTKSVVTKCRYCGKPIGSFKVKDKVSVMLNSMGYNTQFVDVCNDCKQKELTKMWLQRIGVSK
jgi:ferredoxin